MDEPESLKRNEADERSSAQNEQTMPKRKSFADYYLGTILRPRRTFDALLADDRRLGFGLLALLIMVALYTLVYVFLFLGGGAPSAFTPFLAIPKDVYYYYNQFFLAPSMLMCWILAAGVAQLLSHLFSGKGSFEDTLSVFGFGISIATLPGLAHDLVFALFGAVGVLNLRQAEAALNAPTMSRTVLWIFYGLYFIWFLVLFPKGIGSAQRIRRGPAILVGVLAFLVYQGVFVIFNR